MSQNIPEVANTSSTQNSAEFVRLLVFDTYAPVNFGNLVANTNYAIHYAGSANWTSVGSPSNNINQFFTATGSGTIGPSGNAYVATQITFSSSYKSETINNETYTPLGGLLSIGPLQNDIRVTSSDTIIAVSGISGNNIATVLNNNVRGSVIELYRGFYDSNYNLANAYLRFTGIVTSYAIEEDRKDLDDVFTVSLTASSTKVILENRIAGRKTNQAAWQYWFPTDTSMNDVNSLAGVTFAFGGAPGNVAILPGAGSSTGSSGGSGSYPTVRTGPYPGGTPPRTIGPQIRQGSGTG